MLNAPRIDVTAGLEEMRRIWRRNFALLIFVGLFSFFVNLLMLTGPIFMLQIYDRVLGSRSEATLVALTMVMGFLFLMMGILDYTRGRVLARVGARLQLALDRRVFTAMIDRAPVRDKDRVARNQIYDVDALQRYFASPVAAASFDIPWTPIFLVGISVFHPWLGLLAIVGGAILICVTVLNQLRTAQPSREAQAQAAQSQRLAEQIRADTEVVRSLGMTGNAFDRWEMSRREALALGLLSADRSGTYGSMTKTFRQFLQSAMLGLGCYLVLQDELTAGAMIAASILLGRALAPIDLTIGQWGTVQQARKGWNALTELLAEVPERAPRTPLPAPAAHLSVQNVAIYPPGMRTPTLRQISFTVEPGTALGVIGPSGSGKSTLAKALTGAWTASVGKIRLDRAALDQFETETLARYIGYLPQRVQLYDGTIAENIARMSLQPDPEAVVRAAQKAAAHELILKLPNGYDTRIVASSLSLSGGQIQRIGLARAFYQDPVLVILDEPNAHLDGEGSSALNMAVSTLKQDGRAAVIMAHRPSAIVECDTLLMLEDGQQKAFGPRDEVLERSVENHREIIRAAGLRSVK